LPASPRRPSCGGFTPTPVVSRAILVHNRGRSDGLAHGVLFTPSHNPPPDGGFKCNPPHGGFRGEAHLAQIVEQAREIVTAAIA
jgi:phosphoglucomutase